MTIIAIPEYDAQTGERVVFPPRESEANLLQRKRLSAFRGSMDLVGAGGWGLGLHWVIEVFGQQSGRQHWSLLTEHT